MKAMGSIGRRFLTENNVVDLEPVILIPGMVATGYFIVSHLPGRLQNFGI
jgi:hypothetical protein